MERFVALLRGINVGGRSRIAMADLRAVAAELGLSDPKTYIQSGNLVFGFAGEEAEAEQALEEAIAGRFALQVPVVVRSASRWGKIVAANPLSDQAESAPDRVMLLLSKSPASEEAVERLRERARDGEALAFAGGETWIHFPDGAGQSRLAPAVIDKVLGSSSTARNWRTVLALREMLGA